MKRTVGIYISGCVMALAAIFLLVQGARAQSAGSGTITGTITDPQGAVIADAAVVITNTDTAAERNLTTNDVGTYVAAFLQPGRYTVRVSKSGFSTVVRENLNLQVGRSLTIDLTLPVAATKSTVTVTGEAPLIDPDKTETSQVVSQTLIQNLPINGRRWDSFVLLTPGVSNDGGFGLVSYRGISGLYNENSVDGANNNQAFFSEARGRTRIAYVYSMDTIKEFQVSASNYSAEFGQAAGGVVNAVTKSGTNSIHGDLFYYLRYPSLNALDPINKASSIVNNQPFTQPVHQQQQFGGSVGGPIIKDKLFYFLTYDGSRKVFPITYTTSGGANLIAANCPSGATPAQCSAAFDFLHSLLGNFPRNGNQDVYFAKLDYQLNQKNHLSVNFNFQNWRSPNGVITSPSRFNDSITTNGNDLVHSRFLVADWNSTISSSLVNDFRFQWARDLEFESPNFSGPSVSVSGITTYGMPNFLPRPSFPDEHRWQFTDTVSYLRGHHTLKAGVDISPVHELLVNLFQGGGVYSYTGSSATALRNWIADSYGVAATPGDTSIGKHYNSFTQATDPITGVGKDDFWNTDVGWFVEDSWKFRPNLTLNLGVRYDLQLIPQPPRPNTSTPLLTQYTSTINIDKNNFAPRIGISWSPIKDTVIRAGYGMFFAKTTNSTFYTVRVENGIFQQTASCRSTDACAPIFPNVIYAAPGPPLQAAFAGALVPQIVDTNPTAGSSVNRGLAPDFVNPLVHEGELGIEHQLPGNLSLSATYLFSRGLHLPRFIDTNLAPATGTKTYDVTDSTGATLQQVTVPFYTARLDNLSGTVLTGFSDVNSWYHGLVISVRKPFSNGVELLANYTLSKSIDNGQVIGTNGTFNGTDTPLDPFNQKQENALSDLDQRQRFVSSVYWVPPFKNIQNKPARLLLNGFAFGGIVTIASANPVTGFVSGGPFGVPDGGVTGGEVSSFGGFTGGRVPYVGRNTFSGPTTLRTVDFRISRDIPIHETIKLQLVGEAFNLFNHTNFTSVLTNAANFTARSASAASSCYNVVHANDCLVARTDFLRPSATGNSIYGARQLQVSIKLLF
ncbi:MAG: carboxypeptidase regulatory-like domain-containing protein [Candidatus Acidiferrum sp.]